MVIKRSQSTADTGASCDLTTEKKMKGHLHDKQIHRYYATVDWNSLFKYYQRVRGRFDVLKAVDTKCQGDTT